MNHRAAEPAQDVVHRSARRAASIISVRRIDLVSTSSLDVHGLHGLHGPAQTMRPCAQIATTNHHVPSALLGG